MALQKAMGLPALDRTPIIGVIARLVEQKGLDVLLEALERLLAAENVQFVLLGSGDRALERGYLQLAQKYPTKVGVRVGYDEPLSHLIEAGSDYFVMPSRFEPCGLNQMYSLRYGTLPIVRSVGGLKDSVEDLFTDPTVVRAFASSICTRIRCAEPLPTQFTFSAMAIVPQYSGAACRRTFPGRSRHEPISTSTNLCSSDADVKGQSLQLSSVSTRMPSLPSMLTSSPWPSRRSSTRMGNGPRSGVAKSTTAPTPRFFTSS